MAWSSARGHRATFTTAEDSIAIVSSRGRDRGIMAVRLDGELVATIDLYFGLSRSDTARVTWAVNGLAAGSHSVEVRVTGRKNASSAGQRV